MTRAVEGPSRLVLSTLTGLGGVIGVLVAVLASDVILGVIAGAAFISVTAGLARLWVGGSSRPRHP